jgi:hypothetical protein
MAKSPKITAATGAKIGFSKEYSNTPEGKSQIENLLRKIQAAEAKAAAANQQAADAQIEASEAQQDAAETINQAAETQQEAADKLSSAADNIKTSSEKIQATNEIFNGIGNSLKGVFSSFNDSVKNFVDSIQNNINGQIDQPVDLNDSKGILDLIEQRLSTLIIINNDIFDKINNQNTLFSKMLLSLENISKGTTAQRSSGGGGNKPPRPVNVNTGGGGGGGRRGGGGVLSEAGDMFAGIGAAGAGIGAFFLGLAGSEAIMEKFGTGENLKKLLMNLGEGLASLGTRDLVAIGAAMGVGALLNRGGGIGGAVGISTGIGAVGFGIGAFFTGLAAGDAAMSWMNTDMEALKKAIKGMGEALSSLDLQALEVMGGLLAGGAAAGLLFSPSKVAGATVGMGAIGLGIGSFFAGLGVGDKALTWMNVDGEKLTKMMKNMSEGFKAFTADPASLAVLGGLLGAGAAAGLFGPVAVGEMGIGMGAIGLGIGAFFGGLGAGDKALTWMNVDGDRLVKMMKNLSEGIKAFTADPATLAVLGGLLGAGATIGLFGPSAVAGAATGMAAVGLGIAGFFGAFAGLDKLASWMGADGSSLKTLLVNLTAGLAGFKELKDVNLLSIAGGLLALGPAMLAFFGSEGIAGIAESFKGFWNWMTGSDDSGNTSSNRIKKLVESIKPLGELNNLKFDKLDALSASISNLADAMTKMADVSVGRLQDNLQNFITSFASQIKNLDVLAHGGMLEITEPGMLWGTNTKKVPLKKGILDPSLSIDEMFNVISKVRAIMGSTDGNYNPVQNDQLNSAKKINQSATEKESGSNVTVNNNNVNNNYNGGSGAREPKIGGNVKTSPPRSGIEERLLGPPNVYAATP